MSNLTSKMDLTSKMEALDGYTYPRAVDLAGIIVGIAERLNQPLVLTENIWIEAVDGQKWLCRRGRTQVETERLCIVPCDIPIEWSVISAHYEDIFDGDDVPF